MMTPVPFAEQFADNLYADYCRKALIYKALKRLLIPIIGVDRFADSLWLRDRAAAAGRAWIALAGRDDPLPPTG